MMFKNFDNFKQILEKNIIFKKIKFSDVMY